MRLPAARTRQPWVADAAMCIFVLVVALGAAESQVAAVFARDAEVTLRLRASALGATLATHLVLWLPLMTALTVIIGPAVRDGHAAQRLGPPAALLSAIFVLVAGSMVLTGDSLIGQRFRPSRFAVCAGLSAVGAILVWAGVRMMMRNESAARRPRAVLRGASVLCALLATGSIASMAGTPAIGSGRFRVALSPAGSGSVASEQPNILLVVLDTVRADRMSCYGYLKRTTPRLDTLAKESLVFERAISNSIWTIPSHASLFTGLAPRQHGANHGFVHLGDAFDTLAERLQGAGYETACLSNNAFVSSAFNMTQGFAHDPSMYEARRLHKCFAESWLEWLGLPPPLPWLEHDLGAALTNFTFADWLEKKRDARRPFFVFINYMEAHLPYRVPRSFRDQFMNAEQRARSYVLRQRAYGNLLELLNVRYNFLSPTCLSPLDHKVLAAQYDACLNYLDLRVGELLDALDTRGVNENTVVIVVSDHGEALGEHGLWAHERGIYDMLIHVPLIVHDGRAPEGSRTAHVAQLADLYPTILRLAGVEAAPPAGSTAMDLLAPLPAERTIVAEQVITDENRLRWASRNNSRFDPARDAPALYAIVGPHFKLIYSSNGHHELYDTMRDPSESYNVIEQHPDVVRRMAEELDRWLEAVPAHSGSAEAADMPRSIVENLRSVGYVQ